MTSLPARERRQTKRNVTKKRASIVVKRGEQHERFPCLLVDSSSEGFRVRGVFRLRRGQVVEVIPDEDAHDTIRCTVAWVGKPESKQEGEAGLEKIG